MSDKSALKFTEYEKAIADKYTNLGQNTTSLERVEMSNQGKIYEYNKNWWFGAPDIENNVYTNYSKLFIVGDIDHVDAADGNFDNNILHLFHLLNIYGITNDGQGRGQEVIPRKDYEETLDFYDMDIQPSRIKSMSQIDKASVYMVLPSRYLIPLYNIRQKIDDNGIQMTTNFFDGIQRENMTKYVNIVLKNGKTVTSDIPRVHSFRDYKRNLSSALGWCVTDDPEVYRPFVEHNFQVCFEEFDIVVSDESFVEKLTKLLLPLFRKHKDDTDIILPSLKVVGSGKTELLCVYNSPVMMKQKFDGHINYCISRSDIHNTDILPINRSIDDTIEGKYIKLWLTDKEFVPREFEYEDLRGQNHEWAVAPYYWFLSDKITGGPKLKFLVKFTDDNRADFFKYMHALNIDLVVPVIINDREMTFYIQTITKERFDDAVTTYKKRYRNIKSLVQLKFNDSDVSSDTREHKIQLSNFRKGTVYEDHYNPSPKSPEVKRSTVYEDAENLVKQARDMGTELPYWFDSDSMNNDDEFHIKYTNIAMSIDDNSKFFNAMKEYGIKYYDIVILSSGVIEFYIRRSDDEKFDMFIETYHINRENIEIKRYDEQQHFRYINTHRLQWGVIDKLLSH
jgi:hypothetical protein